MPGIFLLGGVAVFLCSVLSSCKCAKRGGAGDILQHMCAVLTRVCVHTYMGEINRAREKEGERK